MITKTILVVGNDGPQSLETSYARAMRDLGCSVHFWDPQTALSRATRGRALGRSVSRFIHIEAWHRRANLDLLHTALVLQPDLILVIATGGVRSGTLAQLRVLLPVCLLFCIYPDSPHSLDAERIHCLPLFHRVTTSSPAWVDAFQRLGARNVVYLPFAADTAAVSQEPLPSEGAGPPPDVVFVGTWRKEREEVLEQLVDFNLRIWGSSYWRTRTRPDSSLRRRWAGATLSGRDLVSLYRSSRIVLNILDASTWPGPNMRSFERAASGGFSLETRSPALLELFTEGETVECFGSVQEARDKIRYYLQHEDARRRIAGAAHRFVIEAGHTYHDRARLILQWAERDLSLDVVGPDGSRSSPVSRSRPISAPVGIRSDDTGAETVDRLHAGYGNGEE
jgi:Glycosyl transferases group 1